MLLLDPQQPRLTPSDLFKYVNIIPNELLTDEGSRKVPTHFRQVKASFHQYAPYVQPYSQQTPLPSGEKYHLCFWSLVKQNQHQRFYWITLTNSLIYKRIFMPFVKPTLKQCVTRQPSMHSRLVFNVSTNRRSNWIISCYYIIITGRYYADGGYSKMF